MAFIQRKVRLHAGEAMPLVYYEHPFRPVKLITLYLLDYASQQYGTLEKDAQVLRWLYEWCETSAIDIEARLTSGEFLSRREITSFGRWIKLKRIAPNVIGVIAPSPAASSHPGGRTPAASAIALDPHTWNGYMGCLKKFLLWAVDTYFPGVYGETLVNDAYESALSYIDRQFKNILIKIKVEIEARGLTPEQKRWLLHVALPESKDNPFETAEVRLRNYIIVRLLLNGGIRRGELLCQRMTDYPHAANGYRLQVVRRPEDNLDPRLKRPRVKTLPRDIPMTEEIGRLCDEYHRKYHWIERLSERTGKVRKVPPSHPFFILSTQNDHAPLSLDGLNAVFEKLGRAAFPDGSVELTPRVLRNTFANEFMADQVDRNGVPVEKAMEQLRLLCGWKPESDMPKLYARKWIQLSADEAVLARMRRDYDEDMDA